MFFVRMYVPTGETEVVTFENPNITRQEALVLVNEWNRNFASMCHKHKLLWMFWIEE